MLYIRLLFFLLVSFMKHLLILISILLLSSPIFAQALLSEVTAVESPTFDRTPNYTFSSTKEGLIQYRGGCNSSRTWANSGTNSITFNRLLYKTYRNCTITVTDSNGKKNVIQYLFSIT